MHASVRYALVFALGAVLAVVAVISLARAGRLHVEAREDNEGLWQDTAGGPVAERLPDGLGSYTAAATPGPEHARLAQLVGEYKAGVLFTDRPGHEPDRLTGNAQLTMVAQGLFLEIRYSGRFFDRDFEGVGLLGYDNAAERYNHSWVDSMGSYVVAFKDTGERDGGDLSFNTMMLDPVTTLPEARRRRFRFIDDTTFRLEEWLVNGERLEQVLAVEFVRK